VPAPSATTLAASGVTTAGATLNGTVNPNGFATGYYFEYQTVSSLKPTQIKTQIEQTGLLAWWAARLATNSLSGNAISTNQDLTGNGFSGVSSGAFQPVFQTNVLNGQPGWFFDGGDFWDVPTLTNALGDFTLFITAKDNGSSGYVPLFDKNYVNGIWVGRDTIAGKWGGGIEEASSPYGSYVAAPTAFTMMIRREGTQRIIWVNGTNWLSSSVSSAATDQTAPRIGAELVSAGSRFRGWITELALFTNAVPLASCTNTMGFFTSTYGTGPQPPEPTWSATATNSLPAGSSALSVTANLFGLAVGSTTHYRVVAVNAGGSSAGVDQVFTTGVTLPSIEAAMQMMGGGSTRLRFSGPVGASITVLASPDPSVPMVVWTALGAAKETSPGQFEFIDTGAGSETMRFYGARAE
jgi:hypothetical protein